MNNRKKSRLTSPSRVLRSFVSFGELPRAEYSEQTSTRTMGLSVRIGVHWERQP
jgi:hypothetical protein